MKIAIKKGEQSCKWTVLSLKWKEAIHVYKVKIKKELDSCEYLFYLFFSQFFRFQYSLKKCSCWSSMVWLFCLFSVGTWWWRARILRGDRELDLVVKSARSPRKCSIQLVTKRCYFLNYFRRLSNKKTNFY